MVAVVVMVVVDGRPVVGDDRRGGEDVGGRGRGRSRRG